jgi:hypothetical protein
MKYLRDGTDAKGIDWGRKASYDVGSFGQKG